MSKPYTIRIYVPDGDPDMMKIIDKMNWTGIGLEIFREAWSIYRSRKELDQAGIYILVGYENEEDMPTLYIGQGDGVRNRIDSHEKNKDFWDKAFVFVSRSLSDLGVSSENFRDRVIFGSKIRRIAKPYVTHF